MRRLGGGCQCDGTQLCATDVHAVGGGAYEGKWQCVHDCAHVRGVASALTVGPCLVQLATACYLECRPGLQLQLGHNTGLARVLQASCDVS